MVAGKVIERWSLASTSTAVILLLKWCFCCDWDFVFVFSAVLNFELIIFFWWERWTINSVEGLHVSPTKETACLVAIVVRIPDGCWRLFSITHILNLLGGLLRWRYLSPFSFTQDRSRHAVKCFRHYQPPNSAEPPWWRWMWERRDQIVRLIRFLINNTKINWSKWRWMAQSRLSSLTFAP